MGRLIVLEGTDGSGKATQCRALAEELTRMGYAPHQIEFPRYDCDSSALIRSYLGGKFGSRPGDVNAYAASTFYAVDRFASFKEDWGPLYENGGLILADRYTTSNAVHQSSKLSGQERTDYLNWLFDFEYRLMGLPEPDLVLYLDVPIDLTSQNMHKREAETNTTADIHEKDLEYLRACRIAASEAADRFGWKRIACTSGGTMRTIEEIHTDIMKAVMEVL